MTPEQQAICVLRAYRVAHGLTYQQIADLAGLTPESAHRLLTRERLPKMRASTSVRVLDAARKIAKPRKAAKA